MNERILIIGGMGPQASLSLHQRLIQRASDLGAKDGKDFPEIVHLSLPIDDFISDPSKMDQALTLIKEGLACFWPYRWQSRYWRSSSHSL
jgi:aspartate racemase